MTSVNGVRTDSGTSSSRAVLEVGVDAQHVFDELRNQCEVGVDAVTKIGIRGELREREPDRRGDGVESGKHKQEAQSEDFVVGHLPVFGVLHQLG